MFQLGTGRQQRHARTAAHAHLRQPNRRKQHHPAGRQNLACFREDRAASQVFAPQSHIFPRLDRLKDGDGVRFVRSDPGVFLPDGDGRVIQGLPRKHLRCARRNHPSTNCRTRANAKGP